MPETLLSDKVKCYHCGDDCRDGIISSYEKSFCCTGCKLVFELLEENGLTSYYTIQKSPGTRQNTRNEFGYLNNEAIADQILEFKSDQMNRVTFRLPEIHCSACIYLLENLPRINRSIIRSEVNFLRKEASIDYDPREIKLAEVADLLQLIGYSAEVNIEKKKANQQKKTSRVLGMKIGIAGFCFGNVMLFSFPEYMGLDSLTEGTYRQFFSWACLALSLPAFFFSGIGYVTSAFRSLQQKFLNLDVPIALGMITLLFRSTYEITTNSGTGYLDSLTGLIFFLLIGKWFQSSTYDFLSFDRDYKSYFPLAVSIIKENKVESIQLDLLQVGHVIQVRNNEIIPADAELLDNKVMVDYSFVTGESENLMKRVGDQLYAGGKVIGTSVKMKVIKEVSKSYLTRLWNQDCSNEQPDQFRSLSDQISKFFTLTIIVIAISASFFWWVINPSKIWEVFTAILIVACPCALALAAPFTLGSALRVFGKNHLYLKNTRIIEKMAQLTTIVFDKTGTVTLPSISLLSSGMHLSKDEKQMVAALARQSTHPLSRQIYQTFSSDMEVIIKDFQETPGLGIGGNVNGKIILLGSSEFILGRKNGGQLANRIYISIDGKLKGYFEAQSIYREGFASLIDSLNQYKLHLLTGDHSTSERQKFVNDYNQKLVLSFDKGPMDKLDYIKNLQDSGEKVMMIGDGLNDSGALRNSDVGIAVSDNTALFTPASDGILKGGNMNKLNKYLLLARGSKKIVIASFILSFLYNTAGLGLAVSGLLTPLVAAILMPLSSVSVVVFSTLNVNLLAKKLKLS